MKESLFKLLELQEIDNQVDALDQARRDYPAQIALIDQEVEEARKQVQEQHARREELEKTHRLQERELAAASADLKKHQDRLYEVKTNREYDALQIEIEACRGRVSEHENALLSAEIALEELIPAIQGLEETCAETEKERLRHRESLLQKLNSIGAEVEQHLGRREAVRVHIQPQVLAAYDRIRRGRSGLAVVRIVKKGACGGCFQEIPPQRASEVRRNNRIILCESCGRILVWNGA
jgi:predicted  nucleic acid-binding Zn-ribbon protein